MKINGKLMGVWLLMVILHLASCSKDEEKPQTLPEVTTHETIIATATSATVSGAIMNDGNASITEAGFVYSSIVSEPTTSDNKVEVTDFDEFSKELTGLSSGTNYNVRAYAINKKGTSYGEKRTFTTGNLPPVATNLSVSGTVEVGKTLSATYTYSDPEGDQEEGTTFQWFISSSSDGAGETAIDGATSNMLNLTDEHNDKYVRFSVTPKAIAGTTSGTEVKSGYSTKVGAETVTFDYMGSTVTYGTIIGSSGKKWLDRNLGATRVAQTFDDYLAYGDLFQWGRLKDGHQGVTRIGKMDTDATFAKGTTSTVAPFETSDGDVPPTDKFIVVNTGFGQPGDWRTTPNVDLWQGVSGTNNPCPAGWRIATQEEWAAEGITNIESAFVKLKLTYTGARAPGTGLMQTSDGYGSYWTSTPRPATASSWYYSIDIANFILAGARRANGFACRCVKD